MKKLIKKIIALLVIPTLLVITLYIPVWIDDAKARKNKEKIYELIYVGQDIGDAQVVLKENGFTLLYGSPIKPTVNEDYYQQTVKVGNTTPNFFESFSYASGISMPFTSGESPYIIIDASLDGKIYRIK